MNVVTRFGSGSGSGQNWSAWLRLHAIHLAVRTAYVGLGIAAAVSTYSRLTAALGDPIPAAIITLLAVMAFLVVIAGKADRR